MQNPYGKLSVLACETGGRWHDTARGLIAQLVTTRTQTVHPLLRRAAKLAYHRRWWSLLSTALHVSIACAIDPSVDVSFGVFPLADAVDIWARDPPEISSLGYSG